MKFACIVWFDVIVSCSGLDELPFDQPEKVYPSKGIAVTEKLEPEINSPPLELTVPPSVDRTSTTNFLISSTESLEHEKIIRTNNKCFMIFINERLMC